ncbi:MAG: hypothetical protein KGQ36_02080 [Rickettsiales bacterium]|nr:hypothetical protein [Rickettsiales bacterium]
MKKFLVSFLVSLVTTTSAYADLGDTYVYAPQYTSVSPLYASPISSGQNSGNYIIGGGSQLGYQVKNTITDNKTTVYIGLANGMFYANGILLGPSYKTSRREGKIYLNDLALSEYSYNRILSGTNANSNNNVVSKKQSSSYFQAYTKFLLGDYIGSVTDCDAAINSDPNNIKASLIKTVAQLVINNKITSADAQAKIDKVLKSVDSI